MILKPQKALALAKKEIYSFSISPAFFGIAVFFLLFTSIWLFYIQNFFAQDSASLRNYFAAFPLVFILVIPAITMRSWAEERKLGSIELLITMPFSEWDLVIGKFISSLAMLAVMLVLTIPLPLSLGALGHFDAGVILGQYIGSLLLGSATIAVGLFLSSLSKNQVGAFLGSVVVFLIIMLANQITASSSLPKVIVDFVNFFSLSFHYDSFSKGILDTRDIVFFLFVTVAFLFLNARVILYRKWR
jgi:ABC-2 type transport system permease protein